MCPNDETVLYNYYATRKSSKLKKDIKHEKNMFRKQLLQKIYDNLERDGVYDKKNS